MIFSIENTYKTKRIYFESPGTLFTNTVKDFQEAQEAQEAQGKQD